MQPRELSDKGQHRPYWIVGGARGSEKRWGWEDVRSNLQDSLMFTMK